MTHHLGSAGAQQRAQQPPVIALAPEAALQHARRQPLVPAFPALRSCSAAVQFRDKLPIDVVQRIPAVRNLLAALRSRLTVAPQTWSGPGRTPGSRSS